MCRHKSFKLTARLTIVALMLTVYAPALAMGSPSPGSEPSAQFGGETPMALKANGTPGQWDLYTINSAGNPVYVGPVTEQFSQALPPPPADFNNTPIPDFMKMVKKVKRPNGQTYVGVVGKEGASGLQPGMRPFAEADTNFPGALRNLIVTAYQAYEFAAASEDRQSDLGSEKLGPESPLPNPFCGCTDACDSDYDHCTMDAENMYNICLSAAGATLLECGRHCRNLLTCTACVLIFVAKILQCNWTLHNDLIMCDIERTDCYETCN